MTVTFGDYPAALAARDAIKSIVKETIQEERPRYRYGTVTSLDPDQQKATVRLNGEVDSVPVSMGAVIPTEVGQTVRVNGMPGDRYIEDVYGTVEVPGDEGDGDADSVGGLPIGNTIAPPTGLILTTGSLEEDVWIDASWTPPATTDISGYDVELARQDGVLFELAQVYRVGVTSHRMAGLRPATTYGVRIATINRIGVRSIFLPSSGFQLVVTTVDDTIPGQVQNLTISSGFRTIVLKWDPNLERDVAHGSGEYEVHIDTTNAFGIGKTIQYTTGNVLSISDLSPGTQYFARVRAIDNSGNFGPWSTIVDTVTAKIVTVDLTAASVTTAALANGAVDTSKLANLAVDASKLANSSVESTKIANLAVGSAAIQALAVGTAHIADAAIITAKIGNLAVTTANIANLAVDNAKIANAAIDDAKIANLDAGKITAGTINANRIAANSLDVEKLQSSNLSSVNITITGSGAIKVGSPPTDGLLINNQGLRLYQGGSLKVVLDNTGNASFTGDVTGSTITGGIIRTATSGSRIQLDATDYKYIKFYSGFGTELSPGLIGVGGTAALQQLFIHPPIQNTSFGTGAVLQLVSGDGTSGGVLGDFTLRTRDPGLAIAAAAVHGYALNTPGSTLELAAHTNIQFALEGIIRGEFRRGFGGGSCQLRFTSPDATAQASIKVHNGTGNKIHVSSYDDATYIPIVASAFEVSSARDTKKDIVSLATSLAFVKRLNPVSFKFENESISRLGLIADEVALATPDVVLLKDGKPVGWDISGMISLLIKAIQEIAERLPGK